MTLAQPKRMLLIVAIVLIGLLTAALPSPAIASKRDGTKRTLVERIQVWFILPKEVDGKFGVFALSATRRISQETGRVKLSGSAGIGECLNEPGFPCQAFMKPYKVTRFEMDASLGAAIVALKRGKVFHRLTFAGSLPTVITPPAGSNPNACGGTTYDYYLLVRNAFAEGEMFGRKVSTSTEYEPERATERLGRVLEVEECP